MSPDDSDLILRWERLGVESTKAAGLGSRLIARWGRPHRFYHGLEHLRGALDALERLGGGRLEAVAVFFHDSVWTLPSDPDHGADEAQSADLARTWLVGALPAEQIEEVARLVMVTADHLPEAADPPGCRVSDADLAVLAAPWPRYAESVAGLRAEAGLAGPGTAEDWAALRRGQITELLGRPWLYRVAPPAWETAARANLTRERDLLTIL